ncbi:MAG TPA: SGNH/GDSL hydrolase family protein [Tepidisphaeraceae bacterium]
MTRWIAPALLSMCVAVPVMRAQENNGAARAAAPEAPVAPLDPRLKQLAAHIDLKDGDTVVFLGDSITHQCLYTQYLEDYFYTRFPGVHVRFHNAGVGGDRAADALARFDMDVAAYKPKYVTILLGMNDGGYKQWDAKTFETYQKGMLELLDKIQGIGATAIVMGPTMFDRDALLIKPNKNRPFDSDVSKYYNAVLAYYGTYMRDQSAERGLGYADMFAPLNDLTMQEREHNPNFTMIPDAIHPNADGHVIMASALLEAEHEPRPVASITATHGPNGWKVSVGPGGQASDVDGDVEHLTFTAQEPALPWVVPAEAQLGYKLAIAGHRYSTEPLRVIGLPQGKYELKINGQTIGTFRAATLASRVELQNFDKCPQYQQALEVAKLDKEKNEKVVHPMRDLYGRLKGKRYAKNATPESINAFIEEIKPKLEAFDKQQADYDQRIYEAAQPKPLKYELTKVDAH